jgi:AcrR family transcriptional regulator
MPYGSAMTDAVATSRRDRNKLRTKLRILEAARSLFTEKGVAGTTIEDLADVADIARATFFNYFASKSAVVDEILNEQDVVFYRRLTVAMAQDVSTELLLEEFFTGSAGGIESSPEFFRAIIAESEKSLAGLGTGNDRHLTMNAQFKQVADRGVARGDVRTDYPSDLLAEILVGAYVTVLRSWRVTPEYRLSDRLNKTAAILADFLLPPTKPPGRTAA